MIKLKNILAENMRRIGTKNLSEEFSDIEKLAFGGPRDPKTGNLITQDTDQNNNGYPDSTEGSADNEFTALLSSLESDLKAYDGHEITYEDDDATMEITVSIYPSERFNEIAQAVNVILEKHPLFKKTRIDRYRDEDGVTLTFDIIKK
jgi:hypothetical protein